MFVKFSSFKMIQVGRSVYTNPAVGTGGRRTEDMCDTSRLWPPHGCETQGAYYT